MTLSGYSKFTWFFVILGKNLSFLLLFHVRVYSDKSRRSSYRALRSFEPHNYNKIIKSDWLSTVLISAQKRHCNRTVRVMPK